MSAKAIREHDGKRILYASLKEHLSTPRVAQVALDPDLNLSDQFARVEHQHPWLLQSDLLLVAKPDQLMKRRGKSNLVLLGKPWPQVREWIEERSKDTVCIGGVSGRLSVFVVEPFVEHAQEDEHYVCVRSLREGDEVLICKEGGVNVGDVDGKAGKLLVPIGEQLLPESVTAVLTTIGISSSKHRVMSEFITNLYKLFCELHFTYLEINPLVVQQDRVFILDLAAKVDQTAEFEAGRKWSSALQNQQPLSFPTPFGRHPTPEEAYIEQLDGKTGASLKLTILNPQGRVWTMVAGGGASVAYADAITALGFADELANYGEYSGAPTETQTFEYSRTLLSLMTRGTPHPDGKVLFIGGGIANFTNVATTFKGIIRAITEYAHSLQTHKVTMWVRRGGPNWQEGLRAMRELGDSLQLPIHVYGPDTHITAIVPMALLGESLETPPASDTTGNGSHSSLLDQLVGNGRPARTPSPFNLLDSAAPSASTRIFRPTALESTADPQSHLLFDQNSRAIVYGMQPKAVQGMLDFDYICQRPSPSVACMVYPFGGQHVQKFYWGTQETLLPVYPSLTEACRRHPDAQVMVNFASFRSVWESTKEAIEGGQIRTIAIIAEGVPERQTRALIKMATRHCVRLVGPATVGGIRAGAFKIGNTGGMIDNILASRLYRPGSVSYVSKSGGMSNELNNIISRCADGVLEGIAIGGDRYPGSTLLSHLLRYQQDPDCKMMVMLGEVGGQEEWAVAEALKAGKLSKPLIAWCIGTCSEQLSSKHGDVQFGHAGAQAGNHQETATAKNQGLRAAGASVPDTFELLPSLLQSTFQSLLHQGHIKVKPEPPLPKVPIDYSWAQELGLIRKPTAFVSSICDDRGQELLYAGMPISAVFKDSIGIGGVVGLLWFRRRLPEYAGKFIEMVLMLTADHGPAVSGAHNTIVAARAGKDLISSLASGLLTIGDRFGGATDGAAEQFSAAFDLGQSPQEFVDSMRRQHKLIMGIGHKIKSLTNPDLRVSILKDFAQKHFPATPLLDYALQVEQVTTKKKDNLILNVDGCIGVLFVDLLRSCNAFTREEADDFVKNGTLNGLFVLGRSIGFIGHYLDQKQLKQGLYRHPWDDISYLSPAAVDLAKLANPPSADQ